MGVGWRLGRSSLAKSALEYITIHSTITFYCTDSIYFILPILSSQPKMMEGLDDEQKEDMRKQMEMQQDPTKMLSQLFGGGDAEHAQTKSAIKAGGKTARRAKRE